MAHTYDQARAMRAATLISNTFWPELAALEHSLANRRAQQPSEGQTP